MDQVDIRSYHPNIESTQLRSAQPKSSVNSTKVISHFSPIEQRTIVPRTEEPASTTSKSSLKNRQRSSTANSALSNNLKQKKEPKSTVPAMISLPTIQRPSRPKEKDSANQLVPHLYAEHRVRSRSGSRENAPPKSLPKDRKKVVAFGRTLTVEDNGANTPQPSKPSGENARLRAEIETLRQRVTANEKLRKDVGDLQKLLKNMTVTMNQAEKWANDNKELRNQIQEVKAMCAEEAKKNVDLTKRCDDLETQMKKLLVGEKSPSSGTTTPAVNESPINPIQHIPISYARRSPAPKTHNRDDLFSRMSPSTNRRIQRFAHVRRENNNNNYEDFENADNGHNANRDMRRRKDEISTFDFNKAQQPRTPRYFSRNRGKENNFEAVRKALASNEVIDLHETSMNDYFQFNA